MDSSLSIDGFGPLPVMRPSGVAALGDVIRRAAAAGTALYPVGGGTMLDYGLPPTKPGERGRPARAGPGDRLPGPRHDHHRPGRHHHRTAAQTRSRRRGSACRSTCRSRTEPRSAGRSPPTPAARGGSGTARSATTSSASRRQRPRRGGEGRRPGGQERGRLRPVKLLHRVARHARRHHPGDAQGEAAAGGRRPSSPSPCPPEMLETVLDRVLPATADPADVIWRRATRPAAELLGLERVGRTGGRRLRGEGGDGRLADASSSARNCRRSCAATDSEFRATWRARLFRRWADFPLTNRRGLTFKANVVPGRDGGVLPSRGRAAPRPALIAHAGNGIVYRPSRRRLRPGAGERDPR